MPFLQQLIEDIDGRIREVTREISSLEEARAALLANGAVASADGAARSPRRARPSRPSARRRPSRRGASRPKRSGQVLVAEAAERILAESDGLTTAALAKQAEADRDQVLALLRDLESAQRVRRTGQRRGTRWHAVTDEDRIQERAAELASRSGSRPT
ncbi:MAG TPA: hypothetical protein VKR21_17080 [Solirubrobacteraceae bacterium]|nr:hypothetical protein [Solirubrobacteraceae bacterium]